MKILVVEDDLKIASGVRRGLEHEGFTVDVALTGDDGLWMAAEGGYDLIVLDIMLPGMNGFEICRELRADENWTPILFLTAKVGDLDEGIAEANRTRFGLSASLIGGSPQDYSRFWANVRAGVINWNRPTNGASSKAPFGGLGLSGNHRPSAYYAADYCAYPVASTEMEQPRASIGVGFREG